VCDAKMHPASQHTVRTLPSGFLGLAWARTVRLADVNIKNLAQYLLQECCPID
jgi:hypothetical protein